ncbi:MAG: sensor histidine kinase, partial [Bacteroidota bacterium]
MRELLKYSWLIILLCTTRFSLASTLHIDSVQPRYNVDHHLEILHDADENITFANLPAHFGHFKPLQEWKSDLLPNTTYWGKLQLSNGIKSQSAFSEWVLHFSIIFTDMDIYVVDKNGATKKYRTGYFVPPVERSFAPAVKANVVKFDMPKGEGVTIYFKGKNERKLLGTEFEMFLQHSSYFFSDLKKEKQWNAVFIGFVLMMFVYNLFLYFYSSDRAYLYYSAYILSISLFTAYNSGDLADWLNQFSLPQPPTLIHYSKAFIYLIMISYTLFVRYFLDLEKLLPRWDTIFKWLGVASAVALLVDFFLLWHTNYSYNVVDIATFGWAFVFLFVGYRFLIPLYRSKDPKGIFVIAGFVCMGIGVLLTTWERTRSVDFSVIYFRIGIILEIISFSLGLAYRQKEVEEEKRQADFELERTRMLQNAEQKEAERLKELNTLKSRLYANITHEFRTPLTVIMGMAEQIEGDHHAKALIQRNSENLLQLINQLLDLSKAESGKLDVKMIQGDIINYLRYLTESFHSVAAGKKIQLTFHTEEKELVMDFDEQKIQYIVYNLLSNAIKYT